MKNYLLLSKLHCNNFIETKFMHTSQIYFILRHSIKSKVYFHILKSELNIQVFLGAFYFQRILKLITISYVISIPHTFFQTLIRQKRSNSCLKVLHNTYVWCYNVTPYHSKAFSGEEVVIFIPLFFDPSFYMYSDSSFGGKHKPKPFIKLQHAVNI